MQVRGAWKESCLQRGCTCLLSNTLYPHMCLESIGLCEYRVYEVRCISRVLKPATGAALVFVPSRPNPKNRVGRQAPSERLGRKPEFRVSLPAALGEGLAHGRQQADAPAIAGRREIHSRSWRSNGMTVLTISALGYFWGAKVPCRAVCRYQLPNVTAALGTAAHSLSL